MLVRALMGLLFLFSLTGSAQAMDNPYRLLTSAGLPAFFASTLPAILPAVKMRIPPKTYVIQAKFLMSAAPSKIIPMRRTTAPMMPQNSTLNQNIWASLEGKVRGWGGLQTYDTLYVVTGAAFKSTKTIDNANGPIAVPSHCWKVLLRQRGNQNRQISQFKADELKAIGFVFTNDDAGAATSIESAVRSVKEIEELTGFKFFLNLDPAVADAVKSQKNLADW